ncbi:hypothetical protein H696_02313 [Fonticula alba]|uniref:Glycoside hydrolase family 5 domain-containing protein n=1 Tax=Fonticula alba TaxID=691883 RepID=A0A058ZBQ4_FONAL|nr:hypothetical protein H696_02313 [Fonticula alba]KCV71361.1 hypothetical protein H696_02313 [Fonticula alba]|eukprot:XP_009494484.1 hypothetical protein H696_02313 [Fonticula alba]
MTPPLGHLDEVTVGQDGHFADAQGRRLLLRGVNTGGDCKMPTRPAWHGARPGSAAAAGALPLSPPGALPRAEFGDGDGDVGVATSAPPDVFFNTEAISFVGRPFPLEEADEHLARLRRWGFLFLRFLITWEALEHAGPGIYDEEYIQYLVEVLTRARAHGIRVFIDPHQDVWSRFSGGSGAPAWTFDLVGLSVRKFAACDAAIVQNTWHLHPAAGHTPERRAIRQENAEAARAGRFVGRGYPKMVWPSNYYKYAAATMFTLFFGGATFAPECRIPENYTTNPGPDYVPGPLVNIQDFLQARYIGAIAHLARRLAPLGVVAGYDTLNEPSRGFICWPRVSEHGGPHQMLKLESTPTAIQGMLLASGHTIEVPYFSRSALTGAPVRDGSILVNAVRASAFHTDRPAPANPTGGCVWRANGVWDYQASPAGGAVSQAEHDALINDPALQAKLIKRDDYFSADDQGKPYDFGRDFWLPFCQAYAAAIREADPKAIVFLEPEVGMTLPPLGPEQLKVPHPVAYAPHWYDGITLFNKHFSNWTIDVGGLGDAGSDIAANLGAVLRNIWIGPQSVRDSFSVQVGRIKDAGRDAFAAGGSTSEDGTSTDGSVFQAPMLVGECGTPHDLRTAQANSPNWVRLSARRQTIASLLPVMELSTYLELERQTAGASGSAAPGAALAGSAPVAAGEQQPAPATITPNADNDLESASTGLGSSAPLIGTPSASAAPATAASTTTATALAPGPLAAGGGRLAGLPHLGQGARIQAPREVIWSEPSTEEEDVCRALDATLSAMDQNLASFTAWTYCRTNSGAGRLGLDPHRPFPTHAEWTGGDMWNDEDFSVWSGARARLEQHLATTVARPRPEDHSGDEQQPLRGEVPQVMRDQECQQPGCPGCGATALLPSPESPSSGFLPGMFKAAMSMVSRPFSRTTLPPHCFFRQTAGVADQETGRPDAPLPPFFRSRLDIGGRSLHASSRPYAIKTVGVPMYHSFNMYSGVFELRYCSTGVDAHGRPQVQPFDNGGEDSLATEIYLPPYHYGESEEFFHVEVSDGTWRFLPERHVLLFIHSSAQPMAGSKGTTLPDRVHSIRISRKALPTLGASSSIGASASPTAAAATAAGTTPVPAPEPAVEAPTEPTADEPAADAPAAETEAAST